MIRINGNKKKVKKYTYAKLHKKSPKAYGDWRQCLLILHKIITGIYIKNLNRAIFYHSLQSL